VKLAVFGLQQATFDLGPRQVTRGGTYHYMSSRNNNFSNRSQKGVIVVRERQIKATRAGAVDDGPTSVLTGRFRMKRIADDATDDEIRSLALAAIFDAAGFYVQHALTAAAVSVTSVTVTRGVATTTTPTTSSARRRLLTTSSTAVVAYSIVTAAGADADAVAAAMGSTGGGTLEQQLNLQTKLGGDVVVEADDAAALAPTVATIATAAETVAFEPVSWGGEASLSVDGAFLAVDVVANDGVTPTAAASAELWIERVGGGDTVGFYVVVNPPTFTVDPGRSVVLKFNTVPRGNPFIDSGRWCFRVLL
jgi:hypothetical protein